MQKPLRPASLLLIATCFLAVTFYALPQLVAVVRGVATRGWEGLPVNGLAEGIALSLYTTALSTAIIFLSGTPLAFILARWRFPLRRVLQVIVELPVVIPPTVAGLALLLTYGRQGLLGPALTIFGVQLPFTTAAVVVAQVFVAGPFYIRAAQVGFASVPLEIEEAARVDGAAGLALMWRVTLPLCAPALLAGLTLSWARALGEFGATILFAGNRIGYTQTLTLFIYNVWESRIDGAIWASVILLALAFVALLVSGAFARRAEAIYR